ncbi:MAG: hypothetical protein IKL51_03020 [Lachnospiraceae bacterium]|nr:hypothetical protein [Lachnospiraceae bacterium]
MNINYQYSRLINKLEKRLGKVNLLDSKYLIIKRECKNAPLGLFGYFITNVAWIEYAIRNNMIPVVDMQNYYNSFHSAQDVGKINTWELFFKQPIEIALEEALNSGKARYVWKDIPDYQPNESLDFLMNPYILEYYKQIVRTYIKYQPHVLDILERKNNEILKNNSNDRVIGVLIRGTDYTQLRPYFHPIQPNITEVKSKIDLYRKKYDCKKIYLATEDEGIFIKMKEMYGSDLLYNPQKRVYPSGVYLNEDKEFNQREPFQKGLEYLQTIYTLSKCNGLVAGRTSGTVGACLLSNSFEFQYIFTLGRYGVEDKILKI